MPPNYPGRKKRLFGRKPCKQKMIFTNASSRKKTVSLLDHSLGYEPMEETPVPPLNPPSPPPPQLPPQPPPPSAPPSPPPDSRTKHQRLYAARKKEEAAGWRAIHDNLLATGAELAAPTSFKCIVCKKEQSVNIYRCHDCGPTSTFCKKCLEAQHRNCIHFPEVWKNTCFQPVLDRVCLGRRDGHICPTGSSPRAVKVFDDSGRPRFMDISFCPCEPEPCTLLRLGLWAATTEAPATAFSVALLEWLVVLTLECHVSVEGFCNAVRWKNNLSLHEVNSLYRALVGVPISEFRHFRYKQTTLQHINPQLDDGTSCPVCPKSDGKKIVTLDANFGLVRKASSGKSYADPHHGTRMFADDGEVQTFVAKCSDATKPSEDCSNFQAGSRVRSKNKQKKLDVSGVFGAACRHEVPLLFVNMTHGERLGYPIFVIQRLVQQAQGNNLQLQIIYDIACVLEAHLSNDKNGHADLLAQLHLALPAFHIYGHKTRCQVLYSTRRMQHFGLTDGEGMERLWSYLRLFFRITKEMTASHRLDLLTDASLHYARRKATDIEASICSRMDKAEKACTQAQEELSDVIAQAPVVVSEADIKRWCSDEKEAFRQEKRAPTSTAGSSEWESKYVSVLTEYYTLREEIGNEDHEDDLATSRLVLRGMKEKLVAIEKRNGIRKRWKPSSEDYQRVLKKLDEEQRTMLLNKARTAAGELCFMLTLKSKYPDGQAIAVRLSRQIKTISTKLDKTCNQYNNILWPPQDTKFPPLLSSTNARRPDWEVYTNLDITFLRQEGIPSCLQRKAIDALNKKLRAEEEKEMLKEEMMELVRHLLREHGKAKEAMWGISSIGQQSLLISHLVKLEKRLQIAVTLFRKYLAEVPTLPVEYLSLVSTPIDYQHEEIDPALEHIDDLYVEEMDPALEHIDDLHVEHDLMSDDENS